MSDEQGRTILQIEYAVRGGDIIRQRGDGLLDDRDGVAPLLENFRCLAPAGAVGQCAVNDDDVLDLGRLGRKGNHAGEEGKCQGGETRIHGIFSLSG
ncbi:hypothetical protein D9M70_607350 [compost metagenome]